MARRQETRRITVDEYTTPSPIVARPEDSLAYIAELMEKNDIRHVPVVKNAIPVGLISERDMNLVANFDDMESFTAKDIMTHDPFVVSSDTPLEKVVLEMSRNKFGSALVMYPDDFALGIFTSTDALNALVELLRREDGPVFFERVYREEEFFEGGAD